jgi:aminoglycoside phosphotransferase (APT) family kinase protein
MIDVLTEAYKELAAGALGLPPGEISILMIHRPHEDKDYADQSVYFFFLQDEEFPAAVGKVGFDPAGAHYLEREHQGLQSLSQHWKTVPPASVPRVLLYQEVAGRQALLQSALPGEKISTWLTPASDLSRRLRRFLVWAAEWNAALGRATRGDAAAMVPFWIEEFCTKLDRTGRSRVLLEGAARTVRDASGGALPAVLAHGDFCGENILGDGERYGVIDWELCDALAMPTYDILDLCLWVAFRTEGHTDPDPFAALERFLNGRDQLAQELRRTLGRYAAEMGIAWEVLPSQVTLAWVAYCLKKYRHLPKDESGHFARARVGVRKILATPGEVLAGARDAE